MRKTIAALSLTVALLFAQPAAGQETTADLQGYLKDQRGAAIPKATVEITSSSLIGSKKKETGEAACFRFHYLPPGGYTVTVSAPHSRTYKQTRISLEVVKLPIIDVTLQIGQMTEVAEVSGKTPMNQRHAGPSGNDHGRPCLTIASVWLGVAFRSGSL